MRSAKHDTLRFDDFVQLMSAAFGFVQKCDTVYNNTGHSITTLHSTLIAQSKSFFLRQHEKHVQKLGSILSQVLFVWRVRWAMRTLQEVLLCK